MKNFLYNDGGRVAFGSKNKNDCAVRAMSVACGVGYAGSRKLIQKACREGLAGNGTLSGGVYREDFEAALKPLGWVWKKAPEFTGRKAKTSDMPEGWVIVRMAKHIAAVKDGQLQDVADCTHKMVYGYWKMEITR
jgi:hypothetical protein